mmetsp:Transcript_11107/g.11043  ORF Transcript_11107/g.11043 Transcript_11107/m.11043 type:complete len:132 (+) Transcript_11107:1176-1571(+)
MKPSNFVNSKFKFEEHVSSKKIPKVPMGRSSTIFNHIEKSTSDLNMNKDVSEIHNVTSVNENINEELKGETTHSLLKEDILNLEPDDTSVDTECILGYENRTMNDESYRKVKNQNLLSHKEIKELTVFFLK